MTLTSRTVAEQPNRSVSGRCPWSSFISNHQLPFNWGPHILYFHDHWHFQWNFGQQDRHSAALSCSFWSVPVFSRAVWRNAPSSSSSSWSISPSFYCYQGCRRSHSIIFANSREFTVKDQTITEWRFNYGKMIDEVEPLWALAYNILASALGAFL